MSEKNFSEVLSQQFLRQYRRDRFWKNVRFFFIVALLICYGVWLSRGRGQSSSPQLANPQQPYVSLIRLSGEIMANKPFSAAHVIPQLEHAFADTRARGVVLDINSPGGSPVQASIIHDKIVQLEHRYPGKKVTVMGGDSLASGAYLVAVAADKIYVNPSTITGSIGVVMRGFGFQDAMRKIGVTRRVFTSGISKSRLDAFEPLQAGDVKKIHHVLDAVHKIFMADVILGRGKRLQGSPKQLFSGDFWTGSEATQLGLVDGTADLWQVLAKEYHVKQFKDYTVHPSLLQNALRNLSTELDINYQTKASPHLSEDFS